MVGTKLKIATRAKRQQTRDCAFDGTSIIASGTTFKAIDLELIVMRIHILCIHTVEISEKTKQDKAVRLR